MTRKCAKTWQLAFDMFQWDLAEDGAFDDVNAEEAWADMDESQRNQYYDDAVAAKKKDG